MDFPGHKKDRRTQVRILVPKGSENKPSLLAAEMVVEQEGRSRPLRLVKAMVDSPSALKAFGVEDGEPVVIIKGRGGTKTLTGRDIKAAAIRKAIADVGGEPDAAAQ